MDKAQQIIDANKRRAESVGIGGEGSNTKEQQIVGFSREQAARIGVMASVGTNADEYARNVQIARDTGLPIQTVINQPLEAQRRYQLGAIDFDSLNRNVPEIINLLGDEQRAKMSYDDLPALTWLAVNIKNGFKSLGAGVTGDTFGRVLHGTGETFAIAERYIHGRTRAFFGDDVANALEINNETVQSFLPQNILRNAGQSLIDEAEGFKPQGHEQNFFTDVMGGIGQIGGQVAMLALPGGFLGNAGRGVSIANQASAGLRTVSGTGLLGAQGVSQVSSMVKDDDAPQWRKDLAMLAGGAVTAGTERFALDKILGSMYLPIKNKLAASLAETAIAAGSEGLSETTESILQDVIRINLTNPQAEVRFDDALYEGGVGATVGGLIKGIAEAVSHARVRNARNTQRARQTEQSVQTVEQLNEAVAESKLLARDPQTFEAFIEDAAQDGPVENIYIDADVLMQSGIAQEVAGLSPSVAEQLELAAQTGGQIAVPLAEYTTRIAPTEYSGRLLDLIKTDPDGFNRLEARQYMETQGEQLQAEIEQALEQRESDFEFKQSSERVRVNIKEQLTVTNRFTDNVNDAYSALVSNFYMVNAARLGVTPEQLYGQYPVRVASHINANASYAQRIKQAVGKVFGRGETLQQGETETRGAFDPETLTIQLLESSDLSTFLHESGHMFLELQSRFVGQIQGRGEAITAGEQSIIGDSQKTLEWLGVESSEQWNSMTLEQKRDYHEKFARGFEAYLFEGKTPSVEMQGVFQRFRAWLLSIYKSLQSLNVELNDDIRGVFDRMLATNEEIEYAQQGRGMIPLIENAEQAEQLGMTREEFAQYQSMGLDSTLEAIDELQTRGLRDMQWLRNARGRIIEGLKEENQQKRDEIKSGISDMVMNDPVYRAWDALSSKDEGSVKLSYDALEEMYAGDGLNWKRLQSLHMTTKEGGVHPDIAADLFGFTSGDEMVRKIVAAQTLSARIENLTDAAMFELYGDLNSQAALEMAADEAIHNKARNRMVRTEYNALAKAIGQRRMVEQAAKGIAHDMVARLKIRDVRPFRFSSAQAKASRNAHESMKKGDVAGAALHKRNEVLQSHAAKAAYNAQEEIEKGLRYLRKFDRDVIKGLDPDYKDQIDVLRERFDLRNMSLKAVDRKQSLAQWIEAQREQGIEPDLPPEVLNEAYRISYKNMTVEEFRGLIASVKQIDHLGRLKNRTLTVQKGRAFTAIRDEVKASINENARSRNEKPRTATSSKDKIVSGLKKYELAHFKINTFALIADGGKVGGKFWENVVLPINKAADEEATMIGEATETLLTNMKPLLRYAPGIVSKAMGYTGLTSKKIYFPEVNDSFTKENIVAMALNMGNASNMQRLLDGEGWTEAQVRSMVERTLTKDDWSAIVAVWAQFESYRPKIAEKERRVMGKEPEWIEPRAFEIKTADGETITIKGGYYPVDYDPMASQHADQFAQAEDIKRQLHGAYTAATTQRSFTQTREKRVMGRPLLYSLSVAFSGLQDVVHDLTHHEALIDVNKLIRDPEINRAIRETQGAEAVKEIRGWLDAVAVGNKGMTDVTFKFTSMIRRNASVMALGLNAMTSIIQITGLTQSIVKVGFKPILSGTKQTITQGLSGARKEINKKSPFMANRARTRFVELNEIKNRIDDKKLNIMQEMSYVPIMLVQGAVDTITWQGAYGKYITDGFNETRAIELADQAVIDSQGSGMIKDQSAFERSKYAHLFTVFYMYFNVMLNLSEVTIRTGTRAKMFTNLFLLITVQSTIEMLLREALTFDDDDKEKDAAYWGKKVLGGHIDLIMGGFVGIRELSGGVEAALGTSEFSTDYKGPGGVRAMVELTELGSQIGQGEADKGFFRALINTAGALFGVPSTQINRTISGVEALAEGKTANPLTIAFGFKSRRK